MKREQQFLQLRVEKNLKFLDAVGEAEALKEVADAQKYEKIAIAEGEAEAIEKVFAAIHKGDPTNDLIAIKYLESLEKVADGNATKVFFTSRFISYSWKYWCNFRTLLRMTNLMIQLKLLTIQINLLKNK